MAFPSPVLDRLGPFYRHRTDHLRVGFRVGDHQLNPGVSSTPECWLRSPTWRSGTGSAHRVSRRAVTVNLTCDYHGSAAARAWVDGIDTIGRARGTDLSVTKNPQWTQILSPSRNSPAVRFLRSGKNYRLTIGEKIRPEFCPFR
jgi:hypothetical protein